MGQKDVRPTLHGSWITPKHAGQARPATCTGSYAATLQTAQSSLILTGVRSLRSSTASMPSCKHTRQASRRPTLCSPACAPCAAGPSAAPGQPPGAPAARGAWQLRPAAAPGAPPAAVQSACSRAPCEQTRAGRYLHKLQNEAGCVRGELHCQTVGGFLCTLRDGRANWDHVQRSRLGGATVGMFPRSLRGRKVGGTTMCLQVSLQDCCSVVVLQRRLARPAQCAVRPAHFISVALQPAAGKLHSTCQ